MVNRLKTLVVTGSDQAGRSESVLQAVALQSIMRWSHFSMAKWFGGGPSVLQGGLLRKQIPTPPPEFWVMWYAWLHCWAVITTWKQYDIKIHCHQEIPSIFETYQASFIIRAAHLLLLMAVIAHSPQAMEQACFLLLPSSRFSEYILWTSPSLFQPFN